MKAPVHLTLQTDLDKQTWETALQKFPEGNFLQSWNWGVFQQALGKTVIRFVVLDAQSGGVKALVSTVTEVAKRGTYLTIAGGPLLDWNDKILVQYVFTAVQKIGKQQQADFIRFRPQAHDTKQLRRTVAEFGARTAQMHLTADLTLELDLTQSEDTLLSDMRKNHRSDIRKIEKKGITVKKSTDPADIREFYEEQLAVAQRHGFVPFGYSFLYEQFRAFVADEQVVLYSAYKDSQLLASAFIIMYNSEAVYHYGVSTPANRKLPGSHACLWQAILDAKAHGCKIFNFWGIAPKDEKEHRFAGVSMFKRGFGGFEVQYLPAHDVPLSFFYYLTAVFEFFRRKIRGL